MQVKVTERTKWRGKTTIVPVFAGTYKAPGPGAGPLQRTRIGDKEGETTTIRAPGGDLVLVSLGVRRECTADTFRRAGGTIAKWLAQRDVARAGVDAQIVEASKTDGGLGALCEGLVLGAFKFEEHKSNAKPQRAVKVDLLVARSSAEVKDQVRRAMVLCEAVNYARAVAHQPPNVLNPVTLADRCRQLASDQGLKCTVLDQKQLKRLEMGAILAVGQGSATPPRLIVLEYAGSGGGKPVALVGKAITFDTGGYSIKTKDGILGMKYDKCGGTAVLGIMQAVASLKPNTPVVGVIAAAENMICGGAYRPDDIITTMSGQTVEIVSADAEGRMVLCDALTYVQRKYQPRTIIDLATLTGGVVVALGKHRAGLFCNDDQLRDALLASGDRTHERLWSMPIDDEYLEALKGDDSDLKNSGGREAHAILGAIFLKQFVDAGMPWAHLDIAGVADVDKDQPYCPKGGTGFGVRLLADYVERVCG
jgi:leucyl aminopeptidase